MFCWLWTYASSICSLFASEVLSRNSIDERALRTWRGGADVDVSATELVWVRALEALRVEGKSVNVGRLVAALSAIDWRRSGIRRFAALPDLLVATDAVSRLPLSRRVTKWLPSDVLDDRRALLAAPLFAAVGKRSRRP